MLCERQKSRAAVLRRREQTRSSSANDDEVGGIERDAQAEHGSWSSLRRTTRLWTPAGSSYATTERHAR
jgi:hypothetical protein